MRGIGQLRVEEHRPQGLALKPAPRQTLCSTQPRHEAMLLRVSS